MGDGFSRGPLPWMGGERFEVCDATTDGIRCDKCDCKIVYDADDKIADAINALGLGNLPTFCPACVALTGLSYQYSSTEDEGSVPPSNVQ